jgi:hypothetical protein
MKLIDKLIDQSLLTSRRFINAIRQVHELSIQMEYIAREMYRLSAYVRYHDALLREIREVHNSMMQHAKDNSLDLNVDTQKKVDGADKPN